MRRSIFLVGLLALLLPGSLAVAKGPSREPTNNKPATFAPGQVCAFGVQYDIVSDNEVTKTWPADANGDVRLSITGELTARLTGLGTGKSLTVNISGPVGAILHPDGSISGTFRGRTLLFFFPTDTPAGPHTYFFTGKVDVTITPGGDYILTGESGNREDLCAALS